MATRAVARGVAPAKVLPPPSPFGELLRRSNFASYDPAIRQTYTAPASYIHRGNWGLKRPIANRKRGSAIVLRKFEEHAQFIEWDKAAVQVDFVKRVEEMNIEPRVDGTPWAQSLGPRASTIDSDFCPTDLKVEDSPRPAPVPQAAPAVTEYHIATRPGPRGHSVAFGSDFGNRGPGAYGKNSSGTSSEGQTLLQPNVAAMTPKQFEEYLEELRELRPKFKEYIRAEIRKHRGKDDAHNLDPAVLSDDEFIINMAPEAIKKLMHRFFLGRYTQDKFDAYRAEAEEAEVKAQEVANTPQPIQGQPHRYAGLVYSNPTKMETLFTAGTAPGLVLEENHDDKIFHLGKDFYVATFAGLTASLTKSHAGSVNALLKPYTEEGLNVPIVPTPDGKSTYIDLSDAERDMRLTELELITPPRVVGSHVPNQSMLSTKVRAKVVVDSVVKKDTHAHRNPHKPGSMQFNSSMEEDDVGGRGKSSLSLFKRSELKRRASFRSSITPKQEVHRPEQNKETMQFLDKLLKKGGRT
ncbi:hypothetical protein BDN70DRAFT_878951 [Pholiota conissans]|uniref:Uncharacterized protein n=1 Tax=Pholiota conissans TaxID=109636 RepID=A0A9P5Z374_9AGAR|nr:hypothetical protein BDN70DRAFT_878951 [Pholiota conissans]